jgi:hypothetical protein
LYSFIAWLASLSFLPPYLTLVSLNSSYQLIEARDMALDDRFGGDPWYLPLHPSNNPFSFRFQLSPAGKFITRNMLWVMEGLR